jgi:small subunit ribosomal protein S18
MADETTPATTATPAITGTPATAATPEAAAPAQAAPPIASATPAAGAPAPFTPRPRSGSPRQFGGRSGPGTGGPGGPGARPAGGPRRGKRQYLRKKKVCRFCVERADFIDYKKAEVLQPFLQERGKILPRRMTGTCARHQRWLGVAIKRAQNIALLPFSTEL